MELEEFIPEDEFQLFEDAKRASPLIASPRDAFAKTARIFAPAGIGLVLIVIGLTSTGLIYTSASRFGGILADVFYGWQAGNLMAMVGVVLIYDALKRSGYL